MKKYSLLFFLHLIFSFACLSQSFDTLKIQSENQPNFNYNKPEQLRDGIKTTTLKKAQIRELIIRDMQDSIMSGLYANIHSILILRHNKLVYEKYFSGNDVIRGKGATGFIGHHQDSLHDVRSVSKSVVSAAIMIAIGQGKLKSLNQRVLDFFPEYAQYDTGKKRDITIQDLMNMSAGLEWDEEIPYSDTSNSERRLNYSADAIDFILSQKIADSPGKKFNYSGGCTQLLAAIIEKVTGMPVDKFVSEFLFKPLGIKQYTWVAIKDGKPSAASGLRLRSRDMAKFGLLFLNSGKWNGKQLIPSLLIDQTFNSQISTPYKDSTYHIEYSNQFWIQTEIIEGKEVHYIQAQGNGGQIVLIDKQHDLVLVITGGTYDQINLRKSSWDIYLDFIYPALTN